MRLVACAGMIPGDAISELDDMGAGNGAFLKVFEVRSGSIKLGGGQ